MNKFRSLEEYLSKRMRMSHVYQPVMIMKLLSNQGKAKADEIAFDLVQNDRILHRTCKSDGRKSIEKQPNCIQGEK